MIVTGRAAVSYHDLPPLADACRCLPLPNITTHTRHVLLVLAMRHNVVMSCAPRPGSKCAPDARPRSLHTSIEFTRPHYQCPNIRGGWQCR